MRENIEYLVELILLDHLLHWNLYLISLDVHNLESNWILNFDLFELRGIKKDSS